MKAEYIDHMGDDLRVVNAARVSFDKESDYNLLTVRMEGSVVALKEKDKKLIRYLADHNHWTPFSHCSITLRETVPIFVARQRFKHMVGFTYNEVSRRYVDSDPEFFYPNVWYSRPENAVKQGHGEALNLVAQMDADDILISHHRQSEFAYRNLLDQGVCPEQARMVLPQSMYTSYYVTGSLAAWARAYNLRSKPDAQMEIQELAKQWSTIIEPIFPVSWGALIQPPHKETTNV